MKGCGLVVLATPSFAVRTTAARLKELVDPGTILVSVSKGIEKDSSLRLSQVIEQELGGKCPVVVLSGPSHAEEVGRHIPTGVVAAGAFFLQGQESSQALVTGLAAGFAVAVVVHALAELYFVTRERWGLTYDPD